MMLWGSPYISWHLNFDPWDTIWALICTICLLINTFFVLKRAAEPKRPPPPKPYVSMMLLDTSPALPPWPHLFYHCMCNTCMYLSLWTQNKFAIKTYVHCHCHLSSNLLTWFRGRCYNTSLENGVQQQLKLLLELRTLHWLHINRK